MVFSLRKKISSMKKKTLLTANFLFVFVLLTNLYSCTAKCKDCIAIPPAIAPEAIALQNINHLIDTATANAWIARYETYRDSICNNKVGLDSNILSNAENVNKQALLKFLCQPKCIGLNIAYGMDSVYKVHNIIRGISTNFKLIHIIDTSGAFDLENMQKCPSYCPPQSPTP
jgi:hypothetical protein